MPPSSRGGGGGFLGAIMGPKSAASFRPKEKYLILMVLATFGFVCFGAIFFLPDFRLSGSSSGSDSKLPNGGQNMNRVYKVYKELQEAGRDLILPAPPIDQGADGAPVEHHPNMPHGVLDRPDPHKVEDKAKLLAQIELDAQIDEMRRKQVEAQQSKVLAKPDFNHNNNNNQDPNAVKKPSSPSGIVSNKNDNVKSAQIIVQGGEDKDPSAQDRRDRVKAVRPFKQLPQ